MSVGGDVAGVDEGGRSAIKNHPPTGCAGGGFHIECARIGDGVRARP